MAETVGLIFGVLGAFNDAVQCFEYVQLARDFDQDYQTAILKLDVARLRLSRWGASVGLDQVEEGTRALPGAVGSPAEHEKAKELLEQIVELFKVAESQSMKVKPQANAANATTAYDASRDLDQATTSLHQKLAKLSFKRFKPSIVLKKAKWALYKEKYLNRLIEDTSDLIDSLVDLFPVAEPERQRLCQHEGTELAADDNVALLIPIVDQQDAELSTAIQAQPRQRSEQTFHISFAGSQNYGLQQGSFSGQQTNHFGGRPQVPQS